MMNRVPRVAATLLLQISARMEALSPMQQLNASLTTAPQHPNVAVRLLQSSSFSSLDLNCGFHGYEFVLHVAHAENIVEIYIYVFIYLSIHGTIMLCIGP